MTTPTSTEVFRSIVQDELVSGFLNVEPTDEPQSDPTPSSEDEVRNNDEDVVS